MLLNLLQTKFSSRLFIFAVFVVMDIFAATYFRGLQKLSIKEKGNILQYVFMEIFAANVFANISFSRKLNAYESQKFAVIM